MSTNAPPKSTAERRRKPETVRKEALAVARDLLIAKGPRAITLKAIGEKLGMTHANLIHHFGSAEAFQARLRDTMVEGITRRATELVAAAGGKPAPPAAIVDQVFETYASGGLGMLMAWSVLTGDAHQDEGIQKTTGELVAVVEATLVGPDAARTAREIVSLVTLLAFAESLIGATLAKTVGSEHGGTRALTAHVVELLAGKPTT